MTGIIGNLAYDNLSTARPELATTPQNLDEQVLWKQVSSAPGLARGWVVVAILDSNHKRMAKDANLKRRHGLTHPATATSMG
jgi:hypothetical protein